MYRVESAALVEAYLRTTALQKKTASLQKLGFNRPKFVIKGYHVGEYIGLG